MDQQKPEVQLFAPDSDLLDIVRAGKAVLFLGAGGSFGSSDSRGTKIPLGGELKDLIAKKFLGDGFEEADFKTVCDFAASKSSVRDLQLFIHEQLYPFHPSSHHLLIPSIVWSGIATTNYDLIVERAYEKVPERLQELVPFCKDQDRCADDLSSNQLLYLKLHGCISRYQDVSPPLVASTEQIINHRDGRSGQFAQFLEWAKTKTIIFVGYGMGDSNLRTLFEEVRKDGDNRPRHYLVRPNIKSVEQDYWAERRVKTISCSFEEWLRSLDNLLPVSTRKLALMPVAFSATSFTRFIARAHVTESKNLREFLEAQCEHVSTETTVERQDPKRFFEGFDLGWYPYTDDLDVPRRMVRVLIDDHIVPTSVIKQPRFIILKAHAGAGKSVVLRRAAWDAARNLNKLVLWVSHATNLGVEMFDEIVSLTNQTIYLFVDNVSESPDKLAGLLRAAKAKRWPLVVIGGARTNEWNIRCQEDLEDYVDEDLELGYLSEPEIDELLFRLELNDCLGHLASLPLEDRRKKLRQEYGRQLLVALHEATKNASFRDIIRDEYEHIFPREAQILYLDVCALHRFGAPVRAGLIARVHGITFEAFRDEFFKPLEKIIDVTLDAKSRDWVYSARHSYIAEIVYEEVINTVEQRFDHIMRIVGKLNPSYSYDREILFEIVRAQNLTTAFTEKSRGRAVYEKVTESLGRDVGILHQWSLYEMRMASTMDDLDRAEGYLSEASAMAPRNTRLQHSNAELALKRANLSVDEVERAAWRTRAEQLSRALIRFQDSSYPHHTLAKAAVQEVRDQLRKVDSNPTELSQEALARSIGKAEEVIRAGLQAFANDSHLLTEEAELRSVLKQADKALPPLEKAFGENPKSELIAQRLARLLEALERNSDAIVVLRKALEFNPNRQSLHFMLAQMLLEGQPNTVTEQSASILYHLERSFTVGDRNHEAQFWYARQLCLSGHSLLAKPIFSRLRSLPLPYSQKHKVRGFVLAADGIPARLYGQIKYRALDFGFLRTDGDEIDVYFKGLKNSDGTDQFTVGSRVTFNLAFSLAGPVAQELASVL